MHNPVIQQIFYFSKNFVLLNCGHNALEVESLSTATTHRLAPSSLPHSQLNVFATMGRKHAVSAFASQDRLVPLRSG